MRTVYYACPKHGQFTAQVRCGFGSGPAPKQMTCTADGCQQPCPRRPRRKDQNDAYRYVSLPSDAYDLLREHCAENGITMEQWIEKNIGGGS